MIDRKLLDALTDTKRRYETAMTNARAAEKVAEESRSLELMAYQAYQAARDAVVEAA